MEPPSLASLANMESLSDIGLRGGADMRPTLLRVLTDLYMQKLRHTPDEERHYTELALRLLDGVDMPTRATVAARLAHHLSPPLRVIQRLVGDLPEVAAPLRAHPLLRASNPVGVAAPLPPIMPHGHDPVAATEEPKQAAAANAVPAVDTATASELNELFFSATAIERGLILRNLDVVAPTPTAAADVSRNPEVGRRLETAALARDREGFAQHLAQALRIPRQQARRIAADNLGESIVVAAKALDIPRDLFYRLLIFVNPAVGQSIERVQALATLYDEMSSDAALGMIAIWQALGVFKRIAAKHQPLFGSDGIPSPARAAPAMQRASLPLQTSKRRSAS